jgi:hypothetical protein
MLLPLWGVLTVGALWILSTRSTSARVGAEKASNRLRTDTDARQNIITNPLIYMQLMRITARKITITLTGRIQN